MNMLPMYDKFLGEISSDFMDVGGVKTACYFYQGGSNKTILLIHGIGGDFLTRLLPIHLDVWRQIKCNARKFGTSVLR